MKCVWESCVCERVVDTHKWIRVSRVHGDIAIAACKTTKYPITRRHRDAVKFRFASCISNHAVSDCSLTVHSSRMPAIFISLSDLYVGPLREAFTQHTHTHILGCQPPIQPPSPPTSHGCQAHVNIRIC